MNYSKQREIIFDALKQNVVHPTAEALYEIIKKSYQYCTIFYCICQQNVI